MTGAQASRSEGRKVLGLLLAVLWMVIVLSWEVEHSVVWSLSVGIAQKLSVARLWTRGQKRRMAKGADAIV